MSQAAIGLPQSETDPPLISSPPVSNGHQDDVYRNRSSGPATPSYRPAQVGSLVDSRYRLLREIACGGGGIVFEAEHVHTRARVALKALTLTAASMQKRRRILREARALGRVSDPHIVPVLDAGECRIHGPFLAIALVEGRTLESFISSRYRLDVAATVALIHQLGGALYVLGRRGVVHRDVKPSNVLVQKGPCGKPDTAVLIDFGVAKVDDSGPLSGGRITFDGDLVGTPEYMAPEQVSEADAIDHRTDVYGLGALAYECLTGSPPFSGPALAVVSSIIVGAQPQPISRFRGDVPPALQAAVLRALERDPAKRWADTAAFARACTAVLGDPAPPLYLYPTSSGGPESGNPSSIRRKAARIPYQAPARLLVGPRAGYDARVEDISIAGALLETAADVAPHSAIGIRFPLPMSGKVVTQDAIVRWVRARGPSRVLGIEFANPSSDVTLEIEAYSTLKD